MACFRSCKILLVVIPHPHGRLLPASSSVSLAPLSICSQPWGSFHRLPIPSCSSANICKLLLRLELGSARSRLTDTLSIQLTSRDESPLFILLSGTAEQRQVQKSLTHFLFCLKRRGFLKICFLNMSILSEWTEWIIWNCAVWLCSYVLLLQTRV